MNFRQTRPPTGDTAPKPAVAVKLAGLLNEPPNFYTAIALAISLASAATTVVGFSLYFGNWFFAIIVGVSVQVGLFKLSMEFGRIANGLVSGRVRSAVMIALMLFLLVVSSLFSAAFFWDEIFTGRQAEQARVSTVQTSVAIRVEELTQVRADEAAGQAEKIVNGADFANWAANFDTLTQLGRQASANLATLTESRIKSLEADRDAANKRKDALIKQTETQMVDDSTARARVPELTQEIADLETSLATLRTQRADYQVQFTEWETVRYNTVNNLDGTGAGCGPVCKDAIKKRDAAGRQRNALTARIEAQEEELRKKRVEVASIEASQAAGAEGVSVDELLKAENNRITNIQREIADLQSSAGGASRFEGAAFAANLDRVRRKLSAAAYEAARGACQASVDLLRDPESGVAQSAGSLSCDSPRVLAQINAYQSFQSGEEAFQKTCGTVSDDFKRIKEMPIGDALAFGESCVALAQLPTAKSEEIRKDFDKLKREQSGDAFLLTRVENAWEDGESTLNHALASAFGVDFLILFFSYLATMGGSSRIEQTLVEKQGSFRDHGFEMWKYPDQPQPGDPEWIHFAHIVTGMLEPLTPVERRGKRTFVAEANLDEFYEVLQNRDHGLLMKFRRSLQPWIQKYGLIEDGQNGRMLMVQEEFLNYFYNEIKKHYDQVRAGAAAHRPPFGTTPVPGAPARAQLAKPFPGEKRDRSHPQKGKDDLESPDDDGDAAARFVDEPR